MVERGPALWRRRRRPLAARGRVDVAGSGGRRPAWGAGRGVMSGELVRHITWPGPASAQREEQLTREWLVTNGLGGYASGTVAGVTTRRYHGLLVAALPAPLGRVMMLNYLAEQVRMPDGQRVAIGWPSHAGPAPETSLALAAFSLECGMPVWVYRGHDIAIERRIVLPHGQNTVFLRYRLLEGSAPVRLELRPAVHFRGHEDRKS